MVATVTLQAAPGTADKRRLALPIGGVRGAVGPADGARSGVQSVAKVAGDDDENPSNADPQGARGPE